MKKSSLVGIAAGLILLQCVKEGPKMDFSKDIADIQAFVEVYHAAWNRASTDSLKNCWDKDYDGLVYVAAERREAFFTWDDIRMYFTKTVEDFQEMQWSPYNISVRVLDDSFATVFLNSTFKGRMKNGFPISVENSRSTYLLRKTEGRWRIIQYHESSPLMQM